MVSIPSKVESLLQIINPEGNYKIDKCFENSNYAEFSINQNSISMPSIDELRRCVSRFSSRDKVSLSITFDRGNSICLGNLEETEDFIEELSDFIDSDEEDDYDVFVKVEIQKRIENNELSIYSIDSFVENLISQTCVKKLDVLHKITGDEETSYIIFRCCDIEESFGSKTFYFCPEEEQNYLESIDRKTLIKKRDKVSSFYQAGQWKFVPEDFRLSDSTGFSKLDSLFNRLTTFFSIVYISRSSSIENDILEFKIDGYKYVSGRLDFTNANQIEGYKEAFDIYDWIYNGGNFLDKVGLSRNIISLSAVDGNIEKIENKTLASILSGYDIYLKQNVQQYINFKNKATEFLFDMSQKTSQIIDDFASSFKSNLMLIITFFVSVVVINSISGKSENPFSNVFTKDISYISIALLIISVVYLFISIVFVQKEIKRFDDNYNRFKNSYRDILDPNDIEKIFDGDSRHESDQSYMKFRMKWILFGWITILSVSSILVIILGEPFRDLRSIIISSLENLF